MSEIHGQGQEKSRPEDCEVGDWVAAEVVPAWDHKNRLIAYTQAGVPLGGGRRMFTAVLENEVVAYWKRIE